MSGIRTHAAADMLGVSPSALRSWERRYAFPQPLRSAGGHRLYALAEIEAMRLALAETHNVSSAI
jgi:DNA-binding transcriptional MerR regulator